MGGLEQYRDNEAAERADLQRKLQQGREESLRHSQEFIATMREKGIGTLALWSSVSRMVPSEPVKRGLFVRKPKLAHPQPPQYVDLFKYEGEGWVVTESGEVTRHWMVMPETNATYACRLPRKNSHGRGPLSTRNDPDHLIMPYMVATVPIDEAHREYPFAGEYGARMLNYAIDRQGMPGVV